jgi:hypothetical protein
MTYTFDSKVPAGALADKWDNYKQNAKSVIRLTRLRFTTLLAAHTQLLHRAASMLQRTIRVMVTA